MSAPLVTAAPMTSCAAAASPVLAKPEELLKGVLSRPKEHQSFRLRCLLMKGDFAALSAAFYGQRKMKRADILRKRQGMTFGNLADVEQRRVTQSPSLWLGTLHFSNSLTSADEEVQVFSTLRAFQTFAVPPRITLTPHPTATASEAVSGAAASTGREGGIETGGVHYAAETVYTGELVVSNPCAQHTVALSITPLLDSAYKGGVAVFCIQLNELPPPPPSLLLWGEGSKVPSALRGDLVTFGERQLSARNAADPTGVFPPSPSHSLTSIAAEVSSADETTTTLLAIPPQCAQRVRVMLRVDTSRHRPNVEQGVALALFDESVTCSAAAVRIALVPLDERAQQLQKQEQLFLQTAGSRVEPRAVAAAAAVCSGAGRDGLLEEVSDTDRPAAAIVGMRNASPNAAATKLGAGSMHITGGMAASGDVHGMPASSAASPRVLSLHGDCQVVAGCQGTYSCHFTYAKDSPPTTGITIRNNLADTVVDYSVAIWSQGPQLWLLLPSAAAVLEPGETQPLRLNILSTEAGLVWGIRKHHHQRRPGGVAAAAAHSRGVSAHGGGGAV
ncbi:hypothetical protein TraAM80_08409 [Trypanosoma rangeli]|uniref:Uncharacterized protein n=1 Tax=Trypanosoma rangeli TaxID=5698 RepID=A0A422N0R4_TRYRA|nr:uncharacterized protein TraAM80_08409 [Trypanosoma rangeli]RNE99057.1 hypothetical protein TraAM80_08409 [Trypanosoma rangeli]|eukprot:RNE99057.1 hypothetical protein TraAM80_08409 [Trypanosoma rangeli]